MGNIELYFGLATGVFLGNWLLVPYFARERTHTDGFFIGLIGALIILVAYGLVTK